MNAKVKKMANFLMVDPDTTIYKEVKLGKVYQLGLDGYRLSCNISAINFPLKFTNGKVKFYVMDHMVPIEVFIRQIEGIPVYDMGSSDEIPIENNVFMPNPKQIIGSCSKCTNNVYWRKRSARSISSYLKTQMTLSKSMETIDDYYANLIVNGRVEQDYEELPDFSIMQLVSPVAIGLYRPNNLK